MPNVASDKEDKVVSDGMRKRNACSASNAPKSNGESAKAQETISPKSTANSAGTSQNSESDVDDFTQRLLKRKGERGNGESDLDWDKVHLSHSLTRMLGSLRNLPRHAISLCRSCFSDDKQH